MAHPDTILNAIARALRQANGVTNDLSYLVHEWDMESSEVFEDPPLVELQVMGEPNRNGQPEKSKIRDGNGGVIGRLIRIPFIMDVQIDCNVVVNTGYDASKLGTQIRTALYRYDDARDVRADLLPGEPTENFPNGEPLVSVTGFTISLGSPRMDTGTSTTTRSWTNTAEITFYEEIDSTERYGPEEYVKKVVWAHDDEFTATGEKPGEIEYNPRNHFPD